MDERQFNEQQLRDLGSVFSTTAEEESFQLLFERWTHHTDDCEEPTLDHDEYSRGLQVTRQASLTPPRSSSFSSRPQHLNATRPPRRAYAEPRRSRPTHFRRPIARATPGSYQSQPTLSGFSQYEAAGHRSQNVINLTYPNYPGTYSQEPQGQRQETLHRQPGNPAANAQGYYQHQQSQPTGARRPTQPISPLYPYQNQTHSFNGFVSQFDPPTNQTFGQPSLNQMVAQSSPPGPGTPMIYLDGQVPMHPFLSPDTRNITNIIEAVDRNRTHLPFNTYPFTQPNFSNTIESNQSTPSIITTSSKSTATSAPRRSGDALRDPSLPHRCNQCGKTFPKADELRRHISRTHNPDRPLQCPSCDQSFLYPKDLRRHSGTHLEQREAFVCPECQKTYSRNDNLRRHVTRSHTGSIGADSAYVSMSRTGSERSAMSM